MKYQRKPEERKSNLAPACSSETCRTEYCPSPESSLFHYSIIENHPINYEYGSSPVQIVFTVSAFSGLPTKVDLTMRDTENYFNCAEKYSQSQTL